MTLQEMRKDAGLTQTQLSETTKISLQVIQRYEMGYRDIKRAALSTAHKLAAACGHTSDEFMEEGK